MNKTRRSSAREKVTLREYPRIGRYRARITEKTKDGKTLRALDLREHLETKGFCGFTRRGIRLTSSREAAALAETLKQVVEDELLPDEPERE